MGGGGRRVRRYLGRSHGAVELLELSLVAVENPSQLRFQVDLMSASDAILGAMALWRSCIEPWRGEILCSAMMQAEIQNTLKAAAGISTRSSRGRGSALSASA
jgi:hypothetical protein